MGWFDGSDTIKETGTAVSRVTEGVRHLFTGDIPPEIIKELNKIDQEHITARWEADAQIPFWRSSRALVMLGLNLNFILTMWVNPDMQAYWVDAQIGLLMVVNGAFFGSKGLEYIKRGKMK